MQEQLQQLHSHARESVEVSAMQGGVFELSLGGPALVQAIVDVAAQFCKLYWDRSSKSKVLRTRARLA